LDLFHLFHSVEFIKDHVRLKHRKELMFLFGIVDESVIVRLAFERPRSKKSIVTWQSVDERRFNLFQNRHFFGVASFAFLEVKDEIKEEYCGLLFADAPFLEGYFDKLAHDFANVNLKYK
jgi:inhibitor of KinA sporulation pathway (predicted exonuclease)